MTLKNNAAGGRQRKKTGRIIILLPVAALLITLVLAGSGCRIHYGFNNVSIPDTIHTVQINVFGNKARYVNPQLAQRLLDRFRQKVNGQTRLRVVTSNADWEISADVTQYDVSTSGISNQRETSNQLTVGVHATLVDHRTGDQSQDFDVTRSYQFSSTLTLQQAESAQLDDIVRGVGDDLFTRIFSNW